MCQKLTILKHLREVGTISPLEARHVYGIERLASRIDELRQEGYRISTAMKRDPMGKRYAEYRLLPTAVSMAFVGGKLGPAKMAPEMVAA
ncbi:MAG: hypothetical protein INH37_13755 [Myxococcaceae bacterium]|nr:hypothetical protein [Myxococcaceae bacterium]